MVSSRALTVKEYLASLPADRRAAIAAVRKVVRAHLPSGFEETMQYGMISYIVPRARFSETAALVRVRHARGGQAPGHGEVVPPLQIAR